MIKPKHLNHRFSLLYYVGVDHSIPFLILGGMITYYFMNKSKVLQDQLEKHTLMIAEKELAIEEKEIALFRAIVQYL